MRTYFKVKAIFDPDSIEDLTYLERNELLKIFSKLEEGLPEVTLLCSLGSEDDDEIEIHDINDNPIVHNKVISLYGGKVTHESEFQ